jgi:formate dehydrogenase assembly factor FdhD
MSVPLLRDRAMIGAALAAGVTVIAAQGLPLRLAVVAAAVTGITTGMLLERRKA